MQKAFLGLFILLFSVNAFQLTAHLKELQNHDQTLKLHNLGDQFKGLDSVFQKIERIGYYTDKNMDNPLAVAQFEQAQFHLAPIILDLNNLNTSIVIFDCTSPAIALQKVKELGFKPLKANNYGVIIAASPNFQEIKP